jgi:hypothetical protein
MKIKLSLLLLLVTLFSNAQEIKKYTWQVTPKFSEIPEKYKDQPAVVLFDKREIFTRVGEYSFATFVMNHFAVKINKSEAINDFNKIKAKDVGDVKDLRDFHARIIKPNGEIIVLPQEKIVEREVDKVKSIVFEGVEAGDILEYYFILKENPTAYAVEIFQREVPVLFGEFKCSGSGVFFDIYEADKDFTFKENEGRKKEYTIQNIEPLSNENSATNIKSLKKLIYSVSVYGLANAKSWKTTLKAYKKPYFIYFKKKIIEDFIAFLDLRNENLSVDGKITKLDNYLKENVTMFERGESPEKISALFPDKLKLAPSDLFDLYGYILKELGISYSLRVGTNRFVSNIDPKDRIPAFNYDIMYYIYETQKYITPFDQYLSYGSPVYEIQGSKGIEYNLQNQGTEIASIDFPILPSEYTQTNSESIITLSKDLSKVNLSKKVGYTGYLGQIFRNYIKVNKEKKEDKEVKNFVEKGLFLDLAIKIKEFNFENQEIKNNYTNTPFLINASIEPSELFVEEAGNLLIVNIGKVIGKQKDLYQEKTRKQDIDLSYAHQNHHIIKLEIPEGYSVENTNDFSKSIQMTGEGFENKCYFNSSAKIEGKNLVIQANEVYDLINYPVAKYEQYRNVLNATADFFKATVVLKPLK